MDWSTVGSFWWRVFAVGMGVGFHTGRLGWMDGGVEMGVNSRDWMV